MRKINLPVLVLKGITLLPNNDIRVEFDNDGSKGIIDEAELFHDNRILVVHQNNVSEEKNDLPKIGIIAKISHKLELPNGSLRVVITGMNRAQVVEYLNQNKSGETLESIVVKLNESDIPAETEKMYMDKLYKEFERYTKQIPYVSNSALGTVSNTKSLNKITDIIVPYLQIENERNLEYVYETNCVKRLEMILEDIYHEMEVFEIEQEIDEKIKKDLDDNQKEYILRQKIKVIKEELGESSIKDDDVSSLKRQIEMLKAPEKVKERLYNEVSRFETLTIASPELNIIRSYIDWLLALPWNNYTIDNDDLVEVRKKLDESHNGLDEVKTRIIEFLAVKQMTNSLRGPIICLVGPPGVGKTSLAFSIASAMHRSFTKISVGGVHDEAELVGHRRTYLGASPGRIIQSLKKAKSSNPVFLIDEIDKMQKDYKGDPSSVLLEILDPEQNKFFSDNYIEEEYDLSKVMFIATANYIEDIPEALKDRLEIVELSGYTEYEKIDIAKKYLIPKICREHGVNVAGIVIKDDVIKKIIRSYTKEAGVRELERKIATIIRKIVTSIVEKRILMNKYIIDIKKVEEFLGKPKYDIYKGVISEIGVVNGLAYTQYGGDILPIEVTYFKGTGTLVLTGSLGDIMKESAMIALDYIKTNYKEFGIKYDDLIQNDIHIHVPEAAIPKEGPSAGITLTTALISAFTKLKIPKKLAMTGEITLKGTILPIGGLKEKSIGALRTGIQKIIIPEANARDLDEIPSEVKDNIEYITVKDYKEVFDILKEVTT